MDTQVPEQGQWLADTRISDALPYGILITDAEGYCLYSNAAFRELAHVAAVQVPGMHWLTFIDPRDRAQARDWAAQGQVLGQSPVWQARMLQSDGSATWVRQQVVALAEPWNGGRRLFTFEDVTREKAREQARVEYEEWLSDECEQYRVTLDAIADGVVSTDAHGAVTYMNGMAEQLTGWNRWQALGHRLSEVLPVLDAAMHEPALDPAQLALSRDSIIQLSADHVLVCPDGEQITIEDSAAPIYNRQGTLTGAAVVFHDIRYSRDMTDKLAHLAHHDPLTGLVNRVTLVDRLEYALAVAGRQNTRPAVLFIDLDNFKEINDRLGHACGDQLLVAIAQELAGSVREADTVCRYGGDEFVILLSEIGDPDNALAVARHLSERVARSRRLAGFDATVHISIGISVYPEDSRDAHGLLRSADAAMYKAKDRGGNPAFLHEHD